MILKLLKKLFKRRYNEYDIVWAKRYNNKKEYDNIPYGHKEGPYIIIKKKLFGIYALSCGSTNNNDAFKYKLDKIKYGLNKDSFVYLGKISKLCNSRYIRTLNKLDYIDRNNIFKRLVILNNRYHNLDKHNIINNYKYNLCVGDIIKYNNKTYYINELNDNYINCHQIYYSIKSSNVFKVNKTNYDFNLDKVSKIIINNDIKLIDMTNIDTIKSIDIYKYNLFNKNHILNNGSLIKIDYIYYYVYSITNKYIHTYRMYVKKQNNTYKVVINNKTYYTKFVKYKFSTDINYNYYCCATDIEKSKINKKAKYINYSYKEPYISGRFKKKMVIINDDTKEQYVITKRYRNTITYMSLFDNKLYEYTLNTQDDFNFDIIEEMDKYSFYNIMYKLENKSQET